MHRSTKVNRAYISSVCVDCVSTCSMRTYEPVQLSQMCVTGTRTDVRVTRRATHYVIDVNRRPLTSVLTIISLVHNIEQMHSFIILVAIATVATSQAQELGADMDGNLVASVKGRCFFTL